MISVIIPTYNESVNIRRLLPEVAGALERAGSGPFEIVVMDDDSPDKTCEAVAAFGDARFRAVNRRGRPRGLSAAVIDGFDEAKGDILVVMDADLSHPPSVVPALVTAVQRGALVAAGSRYVPGGGIRNWPLKRVITSRAACLMARPFTKVRDATSGFFALKREVLRDVKLDALGFKIGLEVFVKARHGGRIKEVPYVFTDRCEGQSKLGPKVMGSYLKQLWGLCVRTKKL